MGASDGRDPTFAYTSLANANELQLSHGRLVLADESEYPEGAPREWEALVIMAGIFALAGSLLVYERFAVAAFGGAMLMLLLFLPLTFAGLSGASLLIPPVGAGLFFAAGLEAELPRPQIQEPFLVLFTIGAALVALGLDLIVLHWRGPKDEVSRARDVFHWGA